MVARSPGRYARRRGSHALTVNSAGRLFAWIAILAAALYIVLIGGGYPGLASLHAKVIIQVSAVAILGTWLAVSIIRPSWRVTTPLLVPVLLASGAYVLSAVFSERPRLSLEPTIGGLGFALAFLFLTRFFAAPWFRSRVEMLIVSLTFVVAFAYIVQVVINWALWWIVVGGFALPPLRPSWAGLSFGTPNIVAIFLLLAGPLSVALLGSKPKGARYAWLLGATVVVALLLTGTRSAYVAGVVASVLGIVVLRGRKIMGYVTGARPVLKPAHRMAALLGAGAAGAVTLAFAPAILHRFGQGGDSVRVDLWRTALTIFLEHPLTGSGPGTWVQLKVAANPEGLPNRIFSNAHDLYVQAAAEVGLIGLVAAAVLLLAVTRRLVLAHRQGGPLRVQSVAVAMGVVGFAIQAIFDSLTNVPLVCLLLIVALAWIDSVTPVASSTKPRLTRALAGRVGAAVALAGTVAVIPTLVRVDSAWAESLAGNDSFLARDWPAALSRYERARATDPGFVLYELQAASALARVGRTEEALQVLREAVLEDPVAVNQIGLARLELDHGNVEAALARARLAALTGLGEPTVALNAGIIGEEVGDIPFALEQFGRAVAWNPPLAGTSFWIAADRRVSRDQVVERAQSLSEPAAAALIQAYAGQPAEARTTLLSLPQSHARDLYIAATWWIQGEPDVALAHLEAMLRLNPLDWEAAGWASRVARFSGDAVSANRFALWSYTVQGDAAPSAIFEQSSIPPETNDVTAGLPRSYPAGIYGRPTSPFLLMPTLVLIGGR